MTYDPQRALELLRIGSGRAEATFRDGQEAAIRHIVDGRGRLLVVKTLPPNLRLLATTATANNRDGGDAHKFR